MGVENVPAPKPAAPVRVWLECDFDAEPIEGTLMPAGGSPSAFTGWLGLTAALETLRRPRENSEGGETQ